MVRYHKALRVTPKRYRMRILEKNSGFYGIELHLFGLVDGIQAIRSGIRMLRTHQFENVKISRVFGVFGELPVEVNDIDAEEFEKKYAKKFSDILGFDLYAKPSRLRRFVQTILNPRKLWRYVKDDESEKVRLYMETIFGWGQGLSVFLRGVSKEKAYEMLQTFFQELAYDIDLGTVKKHLLEKEGLE